MTKEEIAEFVAQHQATDAKRRRVAKALMRSTLGRTQRVARLRICKLTDIDYGYPEWMKDHDE